MEVGRGGEGGKTRGPALSNLDSGDAGFKNNGPRVPELRGEAKPLPHCPEDRTIVLIRDDWAVTADPARVAVPGTSIPFPGPEPAMALHSFRGLVPGNSPA